MLTPVYSNKYLRDVRRMSMRGRDVTKLDTVIELLCNEESLPEQYRDHPLHGKYKGYRDCHIEGDWVLVYKADRDQLFLILSRTGSHSDLGF